MHIFSNLKNFLYDKNNFIAIYQDKIYFYNIEKLDSMSSKLVIIHLDKKKVKIKGQNLKPVKSLSNEFMLEGKIESVEFYE